MAATSADRLKFGFGFRLEDINWTYPPYPINISGKSVHLGELS